MNCGDVGWLFFFRRVGFLVWLEEKVFGSVSMLKIDIRFGFFYVDDFYMK